MKSIQIKLKYNGKYGLIIGLRNSLSRTLQNTISFIQETKSSIKNLAVQMGQLVK